MSIHRLTIFLLFSITLLFCATSFAHGPTRQKVIEKITINASAAEVWEVVADFSSASTWMSGVESSTGEGGNEPGATRTLTLTSNKALHETLKKYNATKMMYSTKMPAATHDVSVLPVTNYSSSIQVKGDGETSIVTLKGAFYRGYPNNDPPDELNDEAAIKAVQLWYVENLVNLKQVVESK